MSYDSTYTSAHFQRLSAGGQVMESFHFNAANDDERDEAIQRARSDDKIVRMISDPPYTWDWSYSRRCERYRNLNPVASDWR